MCCPKQPAILLLGLKKVFWNPLLKFKIINLRSITLNSLVWCDTLPSHRLVRMSRDKILGLVGSLLRETPLFHDLVGAFCPFTCGLRPGTHSAFTLQSNFQWLSFEASPAEGGLAESRSLFLDSTTALSLGDNLSSSFGTDKVTSFLDLKHGISNDNKTSTIWTQIQGTWLWH